MQIYFEDILCSEKRKSQHLKDKKASKNDIFIGDSKSDLIVANNHPLRFILINGFSSINSKPKQDMLNSIYSIADYLSEIEPSI